MFTVSQRECCISCPPHNSQVLHREVRRVQLGHHTVGGVDASRALPGAGSGLPYYVGRASEAAAAPYCALPQAAGSAHEEVGPLEGASCA